MENQAKRYDTVNILRMVCAYLVIIIHFMAFQVFGDGARYITSEFICRIAVPFFFITAGYFFYPKVNQKRYLKQYILKLSKVYVIAIIVYFAAYSTQFFQDIYQEFSNGGLRHFLVTLLANGFPGTLWYFPTLIISIVVFYIFLKKDLIKLLIGVSVILLLIGLMGDSYYGVIANTPFAQIVEGYNFIFDNTRNGITFGVPFLTIGALINKNKLDEKIKNSGILLIVTGLIFGGEAYFLMHSGIPKDYNIYFSATLFVSVLFIMALNSKIKLSKKVSDYLREMSLWIYVYHILVGFVAFSVGIIIENSILNYLFVSVIVTSLAYIITKIKFRKKVFDKADNLNTLSVEN